MHMTKRIKSGQELLDEFFSDVTKLSGVDQDTAEVIKRLYGDSKLTVTNIANELQLVREADSKNETEQN